MNETERQRRLKLADTIDDHHAGLLDRRRMLAILAQLGVTSLTGLGGCRRRSAPAPDGGDALRDLGPRSAIDPRSDQHRFLAGLRGAFAGARLRVVSENTPPCGATVDMLREEFVALTGIEVDWELLPLDRVLAKVTAETVRRTGAIDIFYCDQAWIGGFIDDMVEPRALLARSELAYPDYDFDDFLAPLVEHVASYKGQLAAIPFDIPVWIMMYRRDVFEDLGLSVPRTIPEYLAVVKAIYEARAPAVYGTAEGWKSGHYSLLQKMTTWLWGHGGAFFGEDERPAIDDEKAAAGMRYMLELGRYMPPGATTWDWFGEARSFAHGRSGIYLGIGEFFPTYDDPASSSVVGLAEAAPAPAPIELRSPSRCGFDETPGMSHHGGSSLAISRYSRNVDAAWLFLQWATSSDVTTRASLLGGGSSPIRRSNYKDPRITAMARVTPGTTRHFDVTLDAITHHLGTEPHLPGWAALSSDSFAVELGKMTTNQQGVGVTLRNMAEAAGKVALHR
jgi:multiple sugar transport system substrate-binding protein